MTKAFLILSANFNDAIISLNSKNLTIFEPFSDKQKAEKAFENGYEKELFKELINEFENISTRAEIIVVKPTQSIANIGFIELNLMIARHLNIPIYTNENLSHFTKNSKLIISNNLNEILS